MPPGLLRIGFHHVLDDVLGQGGVWGLFFQGTVSKVGLNGNQRQTTILNVPIFFTHTRVLHPFGQLTLKEPPPKKKNTKINTNKQKELGYY